MNERLKKVRLRAGLSQEEFGKRIGIESRGHISALESGNKNITERIIKDVCREFKIRYQWLADGIEPMYEELDTNSMARIDAIMTGENEFAKNLFKEFSKLKKEEWELLERVIKNLAKDRGD